MKPRIVPHSTAQYRVEIDGSWLKLDQETFSEGEITKADVIHLFRLGKSFPVEVDRATHNNFNSYFSTSSVEWETFVKWCAVQILPFPWKAREFILFREENVPPLGSYIWSLVDFGIRDDNGTLEVWCGCTENVDFVITGMMGPSYLKKALQELTDKNFAAICRHLQFALGDNGGRRCIWTFK